MNKLLSRKNMNLVVSLLGLLIVLWIVPGLFANLFYSGLGNLILLIIVALSFMFDMNLGIGVFVIVIILFRFSRMNALEGLVGGIAGPTLVLGGSVPPIVIPVV
jgi:hypothetical protein